jgi:hypothetical protein
MRSQRCHSHPPTATPHATATPQTAPTLPSLKLLFAASCPALEHLGGVVNAFPGIEEIDIRGSQIEGGWGV